MAVSHFRSPFDTHTRRLQDDGTVVLSAKQCRARCTSRYRRIVILLFCYRLYIYFFFCFFLLSTSFSCRFQTIFISSQLRGFFFSSQFQILVKRFHQGGAVTDGPEGPSPSLYYPILYQLGRMVFTFVQQVVVERHKHSSEAKRTTRDSVILFSERRQHTTVTVTRHCTPFCIYTQKKGKGTVLRQFWWWFWWTIEDIVEGGEKRGAKFFSLRVWEFHWRANKWSSAIDFSSSFSQLLVGVR